MTSVVHQFKKLLTERYTTVNDYKFSLIHISNVSSTKTFNIIELKIGMDSPL